MALTVTIAVLSGPEKHPVLFFLMLQVGVLASSFWGGSGPGVISVTVGMAAILLFGASHPGEDQYSELAAFGLLGLSIVAACTTLRRVGASAAEAAEDLRRAKSQTDEALRESEARYRLLSDSALQLVWGSDAQGSVEYVNSCWVELTGLSLEASKGYGWTEAIHPEDRPQVLQAWRGAIETGTEAKVEFRLRDVKSGDYRWHLAHGVPVADEKGRVARWLGTAIDIHDKKEAHAIFLENEERYRLTAKATNDAIWDWDLEKGVIHWNEAVVGLFGYPVEKVGNSAKWWIDHIHPEDRARVVADIQRATAGGMDHWVAEYRMRRMDGSIIRVYDRGYLLKDRSGKPMRMIGSIQDLTARDRAHDRVRLLTEAGTVLASSLRYEETLSNLARLVVPRLCDWCVIDIRDEETHEVRRLVAFHRDPEKVRLLTQIYREYPPQPDERGWMPEVFRTGRSVYGFEIQDAMLVAYARDERHLRMLRELGLRSYISVPLVHEGETVGVVTMVNAESGWLFNEEDLTLAEDLARRASLAITNARLHEAVQRELVERRAIEQAIQERKAHIRLLLDSAAEGIYGLDCEGVCTFCNRASLEMLGFLNASELIGRRVEGLILQRKPDEPETPSQVSRILLPCENGIRLHVQDELFWRADGTSFPVEYWSHPIWQGGQAIGVVVTFLDITERKRAEAERERLLESERAARAEAEHANRIKDEFLSTVSHELRTPLNAILGWATLLRGKSGSVDLQKGLEVIERNTRVQTQIIDDLLDMGRILSGKVVLQMQPVDLQHVIQAAIESVRPGADAKEIEIDCRLEPLGFPLTGDPNRLQQVVWNLLSNAIKFTPREGRVDVMLRQAGDQVEVIVSDNGKGIAPEFLPHLFERFRQADSTTTRLHGGLGLGLSIAKHLVELHGGTISAASAGEGLGATMTVSLPASHPLRSTGGAAIIPSSAMSHHGGPVEMPNLHGLRILVVDDEPDAQDLVKRLLEECGAEVAAASSMEEALAEVEAHPPQVLLSDIGMPGADGYELIARVRQLPQEQVRNVPAAALTAFARSEDRQRALRSGFQAHIVKPVEPAELLAVVAMLAGRAGSLEISGRQ